MWLLCDKTNVPYQLGRYTNYSVASKQVVAVVVAE